MTVGETLTEARCRAGLSIDELSERTRIRGTVIRSIEQDDYEACGGDLYARGYVRALAGAVGIDAQPLIREFDQGRTDGQYERANGSTGKHALGLPVPAGPAAPTAFDLPAVADAPAGDSRPTALDATRFDLPAVSEDPAVTAFDLPVVPDVPPAAEPPASVPPTTKFPAVAPSMAEPSAVVPPAAESPVVVTPTTEFPAVVPPTAESPVVVPPTTEFPVAVPAAAEFPAVVPPMAEPSAVVPPAAESPVVVPPTAESPVVVPPTTEFPVAVPAAAEFPAAPPVEAVPPAAPPPAAAQPPGTAQTRFDMTPVTDDLMAVGYDVGPAEPAGQNSATAIIPALGGEPAGQEQAAGAPFAAPPGTVQAGSGPPDATQDGRAGGRRRGLFAVVALVVLLGAGFLGVHLATQGTATKNTAASTAPTQNAASAAAKASASRASASAAARASASAQASASARASASAQARKQAAAEADAQHVTALPVASVAAYGPDGLGDGDNPGNAQYAIAGGTSLPWTSQWYVTPEFGMLKHGTGLLLNLGRTVTVSSVRLDLSQYQGADLQIRVGDASAPQDLQVAATANDVAGVIKLTLRHPTAARYLLIWFTQLPPDGAGHYQASVSHVVVSGRR